MTPKGSCCAVQRPAPRLLKFTGAFPAAGERRASPGQQARDVVLVAHSTVIVSRPKRTAGWLRDIVIITVNRKPAPATALQCAIPLLPDWMP